MKYIDYVYVLTIVLCVCMFGCTDPTISNSSDIHSAVRDRNLDDKVLQTDHSLDMTETTVPEYDHSIDLDENVIDFNLISDMNDEDMGQVDALLPDPVDVTSTPVPVESQIPRDWSHFSGNPMITPTVSADSQGLNNVYAPSVMYHQNRWWMWYGGQGRDGRDAIFLAWSDDLLNWIKYGDAHPIPIVDHGSSNHVNDPTVVLVDSTFYMYYTEAPIGEQDEVHLATSNDGINWEKYGVVIDVGPAGSWESDRVGRPSVIYEEGEFRMWYDGQIYGVARHVGYATSVDGLTWTKHNNNPIVLNEGAVDVARLGSGYVMLVEGHQGTRFYTSADRLTWQMQNFLFGLSGASYDRFGQVTPHLLIDQDELIAVFYGGASNECWCKNRIAAAFPISSELNLLGCEMCLEGAENCEQLCQANGFSEGLCGNPGSSDPAACCACSNALGCDSCLQDFDSCEQACQASGFNSGVCGAPGSTDPSTCCACQ